MTTRRPVVTLKTLAKKLNLSVTTISRALKNGPEVRPDTIARVKKAAAESGYTPNLGGLKLKTGKSYAICAALSTWNANEIGDAGSVALIQGIQSSLKSTPYNLIAVNMRPGDNAISMIDNIVSQQLADGVILDQIQPQDARVKFLLENNFPFVTYGRSELFTPHAFFDVNDELSTYEATSHLIKNGHPNIALFSASKEYTFVLNRLRGYSKALKDASIKLREELLVCSNLEASEIRKLTNRMCLYANPPTGFLSQNEAVTLSICAGIRDAGLQVGKDIEVISRDGTDFGAYLNPPVSSFYHSLQKGGEKLGHFLLRNIEGDPIEQLQEVATAKFIKRS